MSFQILASDDTPIPVNDLDKEAAEFWNTPLDGKWYASPNKGLTSVNWFDSIGWNIHHPTVTWTSGWNNVKCSMMAVQTAEYGMLPLEKQQEKLVYANAYLKPYFDLIDHWASKGYIPVRIKET